MKKFVLLFFICGILSAQTLQSQSLTWYEGTEAGLIGKLLPTENPYHRADTSRYAFEGHERNLVRCSAGLALRFNTNSTSIYLAPEYGYMYKGISTSFLASRGFDLYIKQNGKWLWAAAAGPSVGREDKPFNLIATMDGSEHECLLYLPMYSELRGLKIGLDKGATLVVPENDFKYRIGVFGSSFTMGVSTSRSGMSYPVQFARRTGLQILSIAASGQCKLQDSFARAIADAQVDAMIFDTFSNPTIEMIQERLFPFIETVQAAHPDIPLIFQRTIYREKRNFSLEANRIEADRIAFADSLMAIACKKYKNVYYIYPDATSPDHESSVDGVHPSNYGYTLWERSIEKKVLRILRRYGIRP